jgi:light-harvesting complex 1 beta chain
MANIPRVSPHDAAGHNSLSFFATFTVAFVIFSAIAVVGQVLGWQWRSWLPGAEGVKSVTGGIKSAVYTFMSHIQ